MPNPFCNPQITLKPTTRNPGPSIVFHCAQREKKKNSWDSSVFSVMLPRPLTISMSTGGIWHEKVDEI